MMPSASPRLSGAFYTRLLGQGTRRGVTSMILGMASFVTNDMLTKLASMSTPTGQLVSIRNITATLLILGLLGLTGQTREVRRVADRVILPRSNLQVDRNNVGEGKSGAGRLNS